MLMPGGSRPARWSPDDALDALARSAAGSDEGGGGGPCPVAVAEEMQSRLVEALGVVLNCRETPTVQGQPEWCEVGEVGA